ncbi:hypothetical protein [Micromonospora sp. URMC 103]|uniref:hypothetical protein n=1 Tax=Micromonospora sp. URMC 103 TaxID=3423406 RepID=UPI003F193BCB
MEPSAADPSLTELILPLVGVLVGGVITGGVTVWTFRQQRADARAAEQRARASALEDERRSRAVAASGKASEGLTNLLLLGRDPDERREARTQRQIARPVGSDKLVAEPGSQDDAAIEAWRQQRQAFVLAVETAALDIVNGEVRQRLDESVKMLRFYRGPEKDIRQSEYRTRYIAVSEGLACLGAFRRGDPLPDRSESFVETMQFVNLYLEELEANSQ